MEHRLIKKPVASVFILIVSVFLSEKVFAILSAPSTSYGTYDVSWTESTGGQNRVYLYESVNGSEWINSRVLGNSKTFTKASGIYKYKIKSCFYEPEPDQEFCSGFSNEVIIRVITPGPDRDNDGLLDSEEDKNGNGIVDEGETNPLKADSDDDGWFDGPRNIRTKLFLTKIEAKNTQEDSEIGNDEVFVTFNHKRVPIKQNLNGYWSVGKGEALRPSIEVARRTRPPGYDNLLPYFVKVDLREDDWFDWTDDDFIIDHMLTFTDNITFKLEYKHSQRAYIFFSNDIDYTLTFRSSTEMFADPNPTDANADDDLDGISEIREFNVVRMLKGLADPTQPDIYMELDAVGEDKVPERYTKEDIVTRFAQRGYAFHLDDGVLGGGEILDSEHNVNFSGEKPNLFSYRNKHFAPERCGIFHYVLSVNKLNSEYFSYGQAEGLIKDQRGDTCYDGHGTSFLFRSDYLDHISDMESIVWIHEFGHNLGLCHLPGQNEPFVTGIIGYDPSECSANCAHYNMPNWDDTAMGSGKIQAIDREPDFHNNEWAVLDLTAIHNAPPDCSTGEVPPPPSEGIPCSKERCCGFWQDDLCFDVCMPEGKPCK